MHRVGVPETTYSSRWPLLSGPQVRPHHWRHCTHSPPTAPVWCPGFPGTRLHSQSPQLQEKVWWENNTKENTKGINLENKYKMVMSSENCAISKFRFLRTMPILLPPLPALLLLPSSTFFWFPSRAAEVFVLLPRLNTEPGELRVLNKWLIILTFTRPESYQVVGL